MDAEEEIVKVTRTFDIGDEKIEIEMSCSPETLDDEAAMKMLESKMHEEALLYVRLKESQKHD